MGAYVGSNCLGLITNCCDTCNMRVCNVLCVSPCLSDTDRAMIAHQYTSIACPGPEGTERDSSPKEKREEFDLMDRRTRALCAIRHLAVYYNRKCTTMITLWLI